MGLAGGLERLPLLLHGCGWLLCLSGLRELTGHNQGVGVGALENPPDGSEWDSEPRLEPPIPTECL